MKYSILIQGSGETQTGTDLAADILASKLVSTLNSGGHQLTHASILIDDTKRLALVGGAVVHEVPEGIATATAAELPAELKKLDKKELQALCVALKTELDALKAEVKELDIGNNLEPSEDENEKDKAPDGNSAPDA